MEDVYKRQPMEWGKYRFGKSVNEVNTDALIRYNDEMLGEAVYSLSCMDKENMREPQDAKISDYTSGGYTIIDVYKRQAVDWNAPLKWQFQKKFTKV